MQNNQKSKLEKPFKSSSTIKQIGQTNHKLNMAYIINPRKRKFLNDIIGPIIFDEFKGTSMRDTAHRLNRISDSKYIFDDLKPTRSMEGRRAHIDGRKEADTFPRVLARAFQIIEQSYGCSYGVLPGKTCGVMYIEAIRMCIP